MFKGSSPRSISLSVAGVIAITTTLIVTLSGALTEKVNVLNSVITFAVTFGVCYLILLISIERFIYDRIKVIYKTITNLKKSREEAEEKMDLNADILSEVNQEVLDWERDKREEIEKLKEAENYRRDFLGNVAHELKTPIFNIQGYLLTLLEGGLEDESINRKYLKRAMRGVERMIALTEDIDTISKLESGYTELNISKFNIVDLADEVMAALEMKAAEKNIKLKFDKQYSKAIYVKGDYDKIGQVFMNLIVNSIKYGKEDGETDIRFHDMANKILIEIADNGPGIEQRHLNRLFERFYRTDKGRSRDQGGTGLGLAIVKHIIEAHGQSVNVRSTEGVGSTFSFMLDKA